MESVYLLLLMLFVNVDFKAGASFSDGLRFQVHAVHSTTAGDLKGVLFDRRLGGVSIRGVRLFYGLTEL